MIENDDFYFEFNFSVPSSLNRTSQKNWNKKKKERAVLRLKKQDIPKG